jgi:hypothetical protein
MVGFREDWTAAKQTPRRDILEPRALTGFFTTKTRRH